MLKHLFLALAVARGAFAFDIHVVSSAPGGDGSAGAPYRHLHDALGCVAQIRAGATCGARSAGAAEAIAIYAEGAFNLSYDPRQLANHADFEAAPLIFAYPDVALLGTHQPGIASAPRPGTAIRIGPGMVGQQTMIFVGAVLDTATGAITSGDRVTIANVDLEAGGAPSGQVVIADRVDDFTLASATVTGGGIGLMMNGLRRYRLQDSLVTRNGCGNCITAGRSGDATAFLSGNVMTHNVNGGVLINPGPFAAPADLGPAAGTLIEVPAGDEVFDTTIAVVQNNVLSDNHDSYGFSFGVRLFFVLPPPNLPRAGTLTVLATGNLVQRNDLGFSIDGGFPLRPQSYQGYAMHVTLSGNDVRDNLNAPVLVDFTRNTAETSAPASAARWTFMQGSTIDITAGAELDGYAWDNPQLDPATGVELGNRLIVNGVDQPHGRFIPYGPQR